jgi:hypothetical protein
MPDQPALPNLHYYREPAALKGEPEIIDCDVCLFGGTSAAVAAAVQVVRMGKKPVIIGLDRHLGGLSSGGLGQTDIGNKIAIGGISREFYKTTGKHYGKEEMWTFEPHVAEGIFDAWVKENNIPVRREQPLRAVEKDGQTIREIRTHGCIVRAKVFIDCSYEGDLLAKAGVTYHVGRESNAQYNETINGVHFGHKNHNFNKPVDPYVKPGDPTSGLLKGVFPGDGGKQGEGDQRVQAYNFRMCLSTDSANKMEFPKPAGYDADRYELLLRYIKAGVWDALKLTSSMPNKKTDTNNFGGFSTDNIGMNYGWPDGDYDQREKIFQDHVNYQAGLMYFLTHDDRLPENVRKDAGRFGLPKDEFTETGGWPHQLYVREARRMIGTYVMTEANCKRKEVVPDSIGLAAYGMDSHNCNRIARDGKALNEGNVEYPVAGPYPIAYRALTPKKSECANLLAPTCVSSSHIAFGSIRMEPVFMVLGQSAATAACMAIDAKAAVQDVEYEPLRKKLLEDKMVLEVEGKK